MSYIDITTIPGRDDTAKKQIAVKAQQILAKELNINENWTAHMECLKNKKMFVQPGA